MNRMKYGALAALIAIAVVLLASCAGGGQFEDGFYFAQEDGFSESNGWKYMVMFEVDGGEVGLLRLVNPESGGEFIEDYRELAGLTAAVCLDGVAVHRITAPDDIYAGLFCCANQRRENRLDLLCAEPSDERDAPRLVVGIQNPEKRFEIIWIATRIYLHTDRIGNTAEVLDMGAA